MLLEGKVAILASDLSACVTGAALDVNGGMHIHCSNRHREDAARG